MEDPVGVQHLLLVELHPGRAHRFGAGALGSLTDAFLYSIGTMTTLGASGLVAGSQWQMSTAVEAVNGTLLFGISTAFIYAVMHDYWPMLSRRH